MNREMVKLWKMRCVQHHDFVKGLSKPENAVVSKKPAQEMKHPESLWVYKGPEFTEEMAKNYFPELKVERVMQRVMDGKRLVYMRFKYNRHRKRMYALIKRYNWSCPEDKIIMENEDSIVPQRHRRGVCSHPLYQQIEAQPDSEWAKPDAWVPLYRKFNRKVVAEHKRTKKHDAGLHGAAGGLRHPLLGHDLLLRGFGTSCHLQGGDGQGGGVA